MTVSLGKKFGTIKGVLIPNITMMFGVVLFLRLGVLTAHSGSMQMLAVIGFSLLIMVFTSFSIGSLATNMHVGSGGIYYIISRTLGVEIGGAIGLVLFFAQLISITLTVSGFGVSVCEIWPHLSLSWVEFITLTLLAAVSGFSSSWTLRLQGVILGVLLAAIGSVLLGSASQLEVVKDVVPFYPGGTLNFWQSFALFYPAMTGIEAGMSLSGMLKTPSKSLYLGNLYSLLFVAACYVGVNFFAAWKIPHDILVSDPFAFVDFSRWPKIVYLGIWGATLSSALGCLLGAPRMLQSMSDDGIIPESLGVLYGRLKEPRVAMGATYVLVAILLFYTTIDQIIPMLATICLVSYGLLNLVCAFAEIMNSPSWRPRLRTHWMTSMLAVCLIIVAMFMTAPGWAFMTFVILIGVYAFLRFRKLETGFQDFRDSVIFFISRLTLYRLGSPTEHAMTWHPQLLCLVSNPLQQEQLVRFAHNVTRRSGILTFATVVPEEWQDRLQSSRQALASQFEKWKIACLTEVYPAPSVTEGSIQLIKAYGIGAIQPNTVLLEKGLDDCTLELVESIDTCRCMQKNLLLMCTPAKRQASLFGPRFMGRKKRIDVWWDPDETTNFDLTISLVTTLTDGITFKDSVVTIKALVRDPNAEEPVHEYLSEYMRESRIKAKIVVSSEEIDSPKLGHLSFVSLKPLEENATEDQKKEYLSYLNEQWRVRDHRNMVIFVTSYDHVDHRAIYFPNKQG